MTQYQCNVCAKIFATFNDAALCHPDVNIIEDVPVMTSDDICYGCGRLNKLHCGCNETREQSND